jgi:uncharacterized protein (DUF1810 family)
VTPGFDPARFLDAQDRDGTYLRAIAELSEGRKASHWMWFVFPQLAGLGTSATSRRFALAGLGEAAAFAAHPVLGARLREAVRVAVAVEGRGATEVFGEPDDRKFRSSMTLFRLAVPGDPWFARALDRYFDGRLDDATVALLDADGA